MNEREKRFLEFDAFLNRHKTFTWALVIGGLLSVVGAFCLVHRVFTTLAR